MAIVLDPAIRILPDEHRIFVLHPGQGKRFYADFISTEAVFLDLPGIKFSSPPDIADESLRNQLRMARRIALWRRANSPHKDTPSRDPSTYALKNPSNTETPKFVYEVDVLYTQAKAGDLIVIPGKGYESKVYFGEFVSDFDENFTVQSDRYPQEKIAARKVKWLNVDLAKRQFNRRLIRLMQNRQAIIQISQDEERREVYTQVYGDYIWKESSGNLVRVTKDDIDLYDLNKAVDLTNYFAAQYLALKKGELSNFLDLEFHDAIDAYYDKSLFGGVNVEIHSPGWIGRPMKNAIMASYVSAMLALSGAGLSAQEAATVTVQNSANAIVSICDKELEADIRQTMEMYVNIHLWEGEICKRRQATKDSVGLTTEVTVKK